MGNVRMIKISVLMLIPLILMLLSACDSQTGKNTKKLLPPGGFTEPPDQISQALDVEVYIDASTSMMGYIKMLPVN